MDKYTPNQKMFYQRKKKEKKNSKPTNLFELYICIQQAIVCGWMMIIDVVNFLSNILIYVSPCIDTRYMYLVPGRHVTCPLSE
jgi:hypothetical protein